VSGAGNGVGSGAFTVWAGLTLLFGSACAADDSPVGRPTSSVTQPEQGEQYGSESSAATREGAAWEFAEGLSVRITGATRLDSQLSEPTRADTGMVVIRIDFSYTNNGSAVNVSDGHQLPVRLLHGATREEAESLGGYIGTSGQLTLRVPARVEQGATVEGAVSFAVPSTALGDLAVLVVEPRRFTEHLFTDVHLLLGSSGITD
jgi:hypothetical protein